jgi:hypothetical protein
MAFFRGWSSMATDLLLLILMDASRGLGRSSSYLHGMMPGFGLPFHFPYYSSWLALNGRDEVSCWSGLDFFLI